MDMKHSWFFQHGASGFLVEQQGGANPFDEGRLQQDNVPWKFATMMMKNLNCRSRQWWRFGHSSRRSAVHTKWWRSFHICEPLWPWSPVSGSPRHRTIMLDSCGLGQGWGPWFGASLSAWREDCAWIIWLFALGSNHHFGNAAQWDQQSRESSLGSKELVSPDALLSQRWWELPRTHWGGKPFPWHCLGLWFGVPYLCGPWQRWCLGIGPRNHTWQPDSIQPSFVFLLGFAVALASAFGITYWFILLWKREHIWPYKENCSTSSSRMVPFSKLRRRILLICPLKVTLVRLVSSLAS